MNWGRTLFMIEIATYLIWPELFGKVKIGTPKFYFWRIPWWWTLFICEIGTTLVLNGAFCKNIRFGWLILILWIIQIPKLIPRRIISLLNRLKNGQCSRFRVWKICLKNVDFTTWFRLFSRNSNFDRFQFLSQFHCERAIYLLWKPWIRSIEKVFWKWKHLWHGRSIQTLVKVLLFH